ncbi:MAG: mechanosensitive ion channel family protein, partial [Bacteroidales bacterium]
IDFSFGISYSDDIDKAKAILLKMAQEDERVLKDENPPVVMVEALGDSSVKLMLRSWVKSEDYWGLFFDTTEGAKKRFDVAGISIPFPQRDVHIYNHK